MNKNFKKAKLGLYVQYHNDIWRIYLITEDYLFLVNRFGHIDNIGEHEKDWKFKFPAENEKFINFGDKIIDLIPYESKIRVKYDYSGTMTIKKYNEALHSLKEEYFKADPNDDYVYYTHVDFFGWPVKLYKNEKKIKIGCLLRPVWYCNMVMKEITETYKKLLNESK